MRLTVTTFLTLDGVMQAPGAPEEDRSDGFEHGGWQAPFQSPEAGALILAKFERASAFLLGRKTFDIFASYWPGMGNSNPIAKALNTLPKYVASTTLRKPSWAGSKVLEGDLAKSVRALKEQPGDELQVWGSGALVRSLMSHGLVDELLLMIFPVVVGSGRRLFEHPTPPGALKLVSHSTTSTGVAVLTYQPSGPVRHGTIGA